MNYMPAAWQSRRARVAQENYNRENPGREVPWEWVEECLLAWRAWKEQVSYAPQEAILAQARFNEFARKIPMIVLSEIFPR